MANVITLHRVPAGFRRLFPEAAMTHQHPPSHAAASRARSFGLAQMSAMVRLAMVLPAIALVWLALWLLVRS